MSKIKKEVSTFEPLLTIAEAALELNRSTSRLRHWILDGTLPAEKRSERIILIKLSEIEKLKENLPKRGRPKKQE